ncbi:hypothetical protein PQR53_34285 [Paraburkholderia fungorum]|uniref:hypothetical protein n=1 Tax=Paraburkholderia fungorum TaxID=134537 RepID=UPI0038BC34BC
MDIRLANFGPKNYLWPECRDGAAIAMIEDADLWPLRVNEDRDGYVALAITNKKSVTGKALKKNAAGRWYNLPDIFSHSDGDIWLHRKKDELWWTISKPDPSSTTPEKSRAPGQEGTMIYVMRKPVEPWSNTNKKGGRLLWSAIYPVAQDFLWNRGTTVRLRPENVAYALALINGDDLSPWHSQSNWTKAVENSRKGLPSVEDVVGRAALTMVYMATHTSANSNGQEVTRTIKNKEVKFANDSVFADYVKELILAQEEACAITGLPLQYPDAADDPEMICSLDRIDSDGHYEAGNLQVVCRFVNRWKSDRNDDEFRRLIGLLQASTRAV